MSILPVCYLSCFQRYQTDPLGLVPAVTGPPWTLPSYSWRIAPKVWRTLLQVTVSSALWLAQGTIKPIKLPLATPKVQAVKQGVQRKTSNQSYYPSHPPLPTWGTLEMSEHTRGRSSTWSVTTVIKKALLHLSHQETSTKNTECWTSVLHSHCHHPLLQVMCSQTEPASSRGVRTEPLHRA